MSTQTGNVTTTADGSGGATAESKYVQGRVAAIRYSGGHGVGTQIAVAAGSQTLWAETLGSDAAKVVYPTVPMHDDTGTEIAQRDYAWTFGLPLTFTITGAGATTTAEFDIIWAT